MSSTSMSNGGSVPLTAVTKRNGELQQFDSSKITNSVLKCFMRGLGYAYADAKPIAEDITLRVQNLVFAKQDVPSVEDIQDMVENQLMAAGHFEAARAYIVYREDRNRNRLLSRVKPEEAEQIRRNSMYFEHPIQLFQFMSKYARFNEDKGRRETWEECVSRVMTFFQEQMKENKDLLSPLEWDDLGKAILSFQAFPAMRVMQMAGPALERCHVGVYNCSYLAVDNLNAFSEALYILMQGTGVGFSVETEYVDKLPRIRKQRKNQTPEVFVIPDTTEGWCDALKLGIQTWFNGFDVKFDYSAIRPSGALLKTKGGQASGPEPLKGLLEFTRNKILGRQGKWLRPIEAHDIMCKLAEIVQVGGVRRSSLISLSDLEDDDLRLAKHGQFWNTHKERMMANNSAVYNEKPTQIEFMREWLSLVESGSGERGIFNRGGVMNQIPKRRKKADFGVNPCGEIVLRNKQFCNLSIAVARAGDTKETLEHKVRIAAIFGVLQSTLTNFRYISEDWAKNCEEERLLGVDITGQADCPLLRYGVEGRVELLEHLKNVAVTTAKEFALRFGINIPMAVTCVKPSGNSAQFLNCSSGLHDRWSEYFIRHVRMSRHNPLTQLLMDEGVPYHPETGYSLENTPQIVFAFPVASPEGATTRKSKTAVQQLDNWRELKVHYTEHNPSATIYVKQDEWLDVGKWVWDNWEIVGGLSFLQSDDHVYPLAPYVEITKEEYIKLFEAFPNIDYGKIMAYEQYDQTELSGDFACVSGSCDLQ